MFLVSGIALTLAACRAGLIGAFPASNARTAKSLADWLRQTRSGLEDYPRAGHFAVNFNLREGRYLDGIKMMAALEAGRVPPVITSVGNPTEIVQRVHAWGGQVFHDVPTLRHAEKPSAAGVERLE